MHRPHWQTPRLNDKECAQSWRTQVLFSNKGSLRLHQKQNLQGLQTVRARGQKNQITTRKLPEGVQRRKLVKKVESHPRSMPWLVCHVPSVEGAMPPTRSMS